MPPTLIEGPYLRDVLDQPSALAACWESLREDPDLSRAGAGLREGKYRRAVLTGMGSSLHALYPLHLLLTRRGVISLLAETSELIHYMPAALTSETLLVAVSQSGRSAEILRLLEIARGRCPIIGVTNDEDSPLARVAGARLLIHAGAEFSVSAKTYVTSLLSLEWLGAVLAGTDAGLAKERLSRAAPATRQYLAGWTSHLDYLLSSLDGVRQVFVTGRGPSLAAALTGGLILKESARFAAEGMSSAAFRHGPFESLCDAVFVAVFEGENVTAPLNRRLVSDIRRAGGRSEAVADYDTPEAFRIPEVYPCLLPIVEILPVQMMSLALAAIKGHEAGRFSLASKVTGTE